MNLPRCLAGQRACPPEDVGGTGGYADFLEAIADPDDPEHRILLEWAGGKFDPEAFGLDAANDRLAERERAKRAGRWGLPLGPEGTADGRVRMPVVRVDPAAAGHEQTAHDLVLRRDVLSFLGYLRDHRVTGITSTGNLPLKAVADVAASFVNPPVLDMKIGDRVFRCRSEEEVFQVFTLLHAWWYRVNWLAATFDEKWKKCWSGLWKISVYL